MYKYRMIEIYNVINEILEEEEEFRDEKLPKAIVDLYADVKILKDDLEDFIAKTFIENNGVFEVEKESAFSDISRESIEGKLSELLGEDILNEDENSEQIREELSEYANRIYLKYYKWYMENGCKNGFDYISAFCCGDVKEIIEILNEIMFAYIADGKTGKEYKTAIIKEIEEEKRYLKLLQKVKKIESEHL